jgi:predicted dehydrogenase
MLNELKTPGGPERSVDRRRFFAEASSLALSCAVVGAAAARTCAANSTINLGLIGCGGRGIWIADLFRQHGGYRIAAVADYFQDRIDAAGDRFQVDRTRRYPGLAGYKRLLESGLDAVAIESPPFFHPEQSALAVEAGVHVYLAKPIAVDVPGCHTVQAAGEKAASKKLCFLVDFQTRANQFFREAVKRVHEGGIGEFVFGEATYHAGNPFEDKYVHLEQDPDKPENRLRAWGLDRALSGDIITEQNIHTLDVMSWIMNAPPVMAMGTGGLKGRRKAGTCWDHFVVYFQYPNQIGIAFSSRQFDGHGTVPEGIRNRMFGARGVLETQYGGQVLIRGDNFYRGGQTSEIYREGAANNIAAFHQAVTGGDYANSTVAPSVRSNLVTILGRTAAYLNQPVYWDKLVKSDERLDARLKGLRD